MVKRILYFLDFPYNFGGAANTLLKQAEVAKKSGKDVLITIPVDETGFATDEYVKRCRRKGLRYVYQKYAVLFTTELVDVIGVEEDYERIENFIRQYDPEIVHSTQINVCVELACRKLGIAHIMNIYPCSEYIFELDGPNIFPHYHICDSIYYQERWRKRLSLDSVCIRNMSEKIGGEKWKLQEPILVCAGIFGEWKNQLEIIKAIHQMLVERMPINVHFLGYANNSYGRKCKEYIEKNHLDKWIKIKGFVSDAAKEIAKYDALICGSVHESFPNVIGEAMAGDTIVISTPVAGVPEVLKDGENSYLCDGFKAENIYKAIKRFYVQKGTQVQKQILHKANITYMKEFSPELIKDKLLSYYEYVYCDNKKRESSCINHIEIIEPYIPYIQVFKQNKKKLTNSDKIINMIWQIPYIKKCLKEKVDKELIIWGIGTYGIGAIEFAKLYFPKLKIRCLIDREKAGEYFGYPVVKVENADFRNGMVWITFLHGQVDAAQTLTNIGLRYHKDFFFMAPMNF